MQNHKTKQPDAKGAKVAQKTQKIPNEIFLVSVVRSVPLASSLHLTHGFFGVFCATFASFASGISFFHLN
jgi:hypothetical protein